MKYHDTMRVVMNKRDALVMANARDLIKENKSTTNGQLYMKLFGTGSGIARERCINYLGLDPDSTMTSYQKMIRYISDNELKEKYKDC